MLMPYDLWLSHTGERSAAASAQTFAIQIFNADIIAGFGLDHQGFRFLMAFVKRISVMYTMDRTLAELAVVIFGI